VIRQAISCDICGADMQQSHQWFIAYHHGDELRVSRLSTRVRSRSGVKHLCGQTCLHKLVDEFLARTLAGRAPASVPQDIPREKNARVPRTGAGLPSPAAHPAPRPVSRICAPYIDEFESSARLIPSSGPAMDIVPEPPTLASPSLASPTDRFAAWKREQARVQSEAQSRSARRSIA